MKDYSKSYIYKLVSNKTNKIYIGSSCYYLELRYNNHKHNNNKCSSKILFDLGEVEIKIIEYYPCTNNEELRKREQYYIDMYKDIIVNKNNSYTTEEQKKERQKIYIQKNKEHIKELHRNNYQIHKIKRCQSVKIYQNINKEKIKERKRIYNQKNKEHIKEYRTKNKEHIKEVNKIFYQNNKDKIKEYQIEYNKNNKDKIKENAKIYRQKNKDILKNKDKNRYIYLCSWGGDKRYNNNLLNIDVNIFTN